MGIKLLLISHKDIEFCSPFLFNLRESQDQQITFKIT